MNRLKIAIATISLILLPLPVLAASHEAVDPLALAPAWLIIGLIVARQLAEVLAKAIPDDATGVMALVRKIAKIAAIYIPNRTAK